jgi:hypothetical protein
LVEGGGRRKGRSECGVVEPLSEEGRAGRSERAETERAVGQGEWKGRGRREEKGEEKEDEGELEGDVGHTMAVVDGGGLVMRGGQRSSAREGRSTVPHWRMAWTEKMEDRQEKKQSRDLRVRPVKRSLHHSPSLDVSSL